MKNAVIEEEIQRFHIYQTHTGGPSYMKVFAGGAQHARDVN